MTLSRQGKLRDCGVRYLALEGFRALAQVECTPQCPWSEPVSRRTTGRYRCYQGAGWKLIQMA